MTNWPAPMAHSYRLGLVTWGYRVRIGADICHRGCAQTVLQTVQRHGVYSAAYGTVHYTDPLKSFKKREGHSPGFGLPSVTILPWLCRKRRKAIFIFQWQINAGHRLTRCSSFGTTFRVCYLIPQRYLPARWGTWFSLQKLQTTALQRQIIHSL